MKITRKQFFGGIFIGVFLIAAFATQGFGLASETTVIITDQGFEPDNLSIKPGTVVVFLNLGKQPHWPASNSHPTHTDYPEEGGCIGSLLDACVGLLPGETYSFQFDSKGIWGIHDHLRPGLTMVIDVKKTGFNLPFITGFKKQLPSVEAFRMQVRAEQLNTIKELAKQDPAAAWTFLKEASVLNGEVVIDSHELAHVVGNGLYNYYDFEGIKYCSYEFAFGCFHGVTERLLALQDADAAMDIQERCKKTFGGTNEGRTKGVSGCIHGLGHGLLNLKGLDLVAALEVCDTLDIAYKENCYDGSFMESLVADTRPLGWEFCKGFDSRFHATCGRYMAIALSNQYRDFMQVASECGKTDLEIFFKTCYENMGFRIAQLNIGDFEGIKDTCSSIESKAGRQGCFIGAAVETVFQEYVSWKEISMQLCEELASSPAFKECHDRIEKVKTTFTN